MANSSDIIFITFQIETEVVDRVRCEHRRSQGVPNAAKVSTLLPSPNFMN